MKFNLMRSGNKCDAAFHRDASELFWIRTAGDKLHFAVARIEVMASFLARA